MMVETQTYPAQTAEPAETVPPVVVELMRYTVERPVESKTSTYLVPYLQRMSVLTVLRYVYEYLDQTVAFRTFQCGRGICNTCRVRLNGKVIKACARPVKPGDKLTVLPYNMQKAIRDVVADMD